MEIKTKYSLSDQVWVMHENKPTKYNLFSIEPKVVLTHNMDIKESVWYRFEEHGQLYHEDLLFSSKEALIQSL